MYIEKNFFVHINVVLFKLVERYILNCDEGEALAVCDAMQKLKSRRNITKETADALTQEKSINPPLMTFLIDERVKLQLIYSTNKQQQPTYIQQKQYLIKENFNSQPPSKTIFILKKQFPTSQQRTKSKLETQLPLDIRKRKQFRKEFAERKRNRTRTGKRLRKISQRWSRKELNKK